MGMVMTTTMMIILALLSGTHCHHILERLHATITTFKSALKTHFFSLYHSNSALFDLIGVCVCVCVRACVRAWRERERERERGREGGGERERERERERESVDIAS